MILQLFLRVERSIALAAVIQIRQVGHGQLLNRNLFQWTRMLN